MSERKLSKRSQRRLRRQVARRLAVEQSHSETKKRHVEERSGHTSEEDSSRCEPSGELLITTESSGLREERIQEELIDSDRTDSGDRVGSDNSSELEGVGSDDSDDRARSGYSDDGGMSDDGGNGIVSELSMEAVSSSDGGDGSESVLSDELDGSGDRSDEELSGEELDGGSDCDSVENEPRCSEGESNTSVMTSISLFPQSRVTTGDFNLALMSLIQRHNLTYASQTDILRLLSIVLPSPSNIPSSARMLINKFASYKSDTVVRHFCGCCTCPLDSGSSCAKQRCNLLPHRHRAHG